MSKKGSTGEETKEGDAEALHTWQSSSMIHWRNWAQQQSPELHLDHHSSLLFQVHRLETKLFLKDDQEVGKGVCTATCTCGWNKRACFLEGAFLPECDLLMLVVQTC